MSSSGARKSRDDVGGARVGESDAEPLAEEAVALGLPEPLGLVEELLALGGELVEPEAEALVELVVVRRAELRDGLAVDPRRLEVDRVQVLVEQVEAGALEARSPVAVGLVRHDRTEHPVGDALAVHLGLEPGLDLGELLRVLAREGRRGSPRRRIARARSARLPAVEPSRACVRLSWRS